MIIYLSGPITGHEDYMDRFLEEEKQVRSVLGEESCPDEIDIINPAKVCTQLPELRHEQYMEIAFAMLEASDAIWMLPGWRDSKGACMEYGFARSCGMEIWGHDV